MNRNAFSPGLAGRPRAPVDAPPFELANYYQTQTSATKLRGQFFTPEALVSLMLDALHLAPYHRLIDPSCGDGSFLRGAVAAVRRRFPDADGSSLARHWQGRLIGFDIDEGAVQEARIGLQHAFREQFEVELLAEQFQVHRSDVLQTPCLDQLLQSAGSSRVPKDEQLLVVGNPPYVEAKRLSREVKAELRHRFSEALSGAPDLYLYFLHVCLGWLSTGDRLAFVLPNKILVNANAQRLRERLLDEGRLEQLWFATQAGVFADAHVYPIVLFATGGGRNRDEKVEIVRLTRSDSRTLTPTARLSLDAKTYASTRAKALYAPPESRMLRSALDRLLSDGPGGRLDGVLDIRWSVSFHHAGLRERYVTDHAPGSGCPRRFLGGGAFSGNGEVTRYRIHWAGWWINYDEDRLRVEGNGVPEAALFDRPKIVICQNGRTIRAAYDTDGFVLKDTFLCGVIRDGDHSLRRHPRALVGLLCSRAVHFFYSHVFFGGHVNGGYLHFLRSFLVDTPVGAWTEDRAAAAADLVRLREEASTDAHEALEGGIEELVSLSLGLTAAEQLAIQSWAEQDANWQARERVRDGGGRRPALGAGAVIPANG